VQRVSRMDALSPIGALALARRPGKARAGPCR
jgi:hypothetical protein